MKALLSGTTGSKEKKSVFDSPFTEEGLDYNYNNLVRFFLKLICYNNELVYKLEVNCMQLL